MTETPKTSPDRRLDEPCPHCHNPIGQLVLVGGVLLLAVGGLVDGRPAGLLIDRLEGAVCLSCGGKYSYYAPVNVQRVLVKRGYSAGEVVKMLRVSDIIKSANGDAG